MLNIKNFGLWNSINTGYNIAAPTEPNDTILVKNINTNANTKHINPTCQSTISNTPNDVATPFPPLNLKNTGKVCPITANKPAICASNAVSVVSLKFPNTTAIATAITPFKISHIKVIIAAFLPTVLKTFVEPALILFLTFVVGGIVLSIVIPMFSVYGAMQV